MIGTRLSAFLVIIMLCLAQNSMAEEAFDLWRGRYRVSAERAELPGNERMGIAGLNYLVDLTPSLYSGIGAYGAMTGQRGGFLVGGIAAGFEYPVTSPVRLEAGIFLGGGGGKSALVGGGLMVRSHAGVLYDAGDFRLGLYYVDLDFPNGTVKSNHTALTLDIPFTSIRLRGRPSDATEIPSLVFQQTGHEPGFGRDFFGPLYLVYHPSFDARNTDGVTPTERFSLIGFEYGRYTGDRAYVFLETAGAMDGNADGYAEVFVGGGYRFPLVPGAWAVDGRVSLGSGGGGRVDTGGGALAKAELGIQYALSDDMRAGVTAGMVDAFRGRFRASTFGLQISYAMDFLSPGPEKPDGEAPFGDLKARGWRIRLSNQVYRTEDERMRMIPNDHLVSLMGLKANAELSRHVYLTGQALGAYSGGAGGYAVGLIGVGIRSGALYETGARIFIEALVGAAGGGGISVGGGAIMQPTAGISYNFGDRLGIEVACGKVKAFDGELDTTVYDAGLVYRFSTLGR